MLFAICDAQLRCIARRLGAAFEVAPLVVGVAGLCAAALPAVALWSGARAAPALHAADPSTLALGAGLTAALVGAALTLLAPGRAALGTQLEAAPVPRATALVGLTLLPPLAALASVALPAALFAAPTAGRATPLVLARLLGAAALGGAAAEAALALGRRSLRAVPVVAALALSCSRAGVSSRSRSQRRCGSQRWPPVPVSVRCGQACVCRHAVTSGSRRCVTHAGATCNVRPRQPVHCQFAAWSRCA